MRTNDIDNLEQDLLLEAVYRRYGYDFRGYSRASLTRRIQRFLGQTTYPSTGALIPDILRNRELFESFVFELSVTVTELFRDPDVYREIRRTVIPYLKTYPYVHIWHAGCATGEEVYAMAILLKEEGLFDRTRIYATDLNSRSLQIAKEGIYPVERLRQYTANYQQAGGKDSLSAYYHSKYDRVIMDRSLTQNMVFAGHNLATDAVFGEMHLIMCRNVLIYFDQELQNRALKLFHDSLVPRGLLCLGNKENIRFSEYTERFDVLASREKIFQKK